MLVILFCDVSCGVICTYRMICAAFEICDVFIATVSFLAIAGFVFAVLLVLFYYVGRFGGAA